MDTGTAALRRQLDELSSLANRGRSLPLVSGAIFLCWGLVLAVGASLGILAIWRGRADLIGLIWIGTMLLGWIGTNIAKRRLRLRTRDGALSIGNGVTRAVWITTGLVVTAYTLASELIAHDPRMVPVVALMTGGIAFSASAAAAGVRLLYVPAGGWIILGIAMSVLHWSPIQLHVGVAMASLLFLALPGLLLLLREQRG